MRLITKIIIILLAGISTVACCGSHTIGNVATYEKATRIYTNSSIGFSSEYLFGIKDLVMSDKYLKEVALPQKYKKLLITNRLGNGEILYTALLSRFNVYVVAVHTEFQGNSNGSVKLPMLIDKSSLSCVDNFDVKWYKSHDGQKVLFYHHSVLKSRKTAFNVFSHHKEWGDNSVISIYFIENYKDVKRDVEAKGYVKFPEENIWIFNRTNYTDDIFQNISQP